MISQGENMTKFENMPVKLTPFSKIKKKMEAIVEEFRSADNEQKALNVVKKFHRFTDEIETEMTLVSIHYSLNTNDEKIVKANEIIDETSPLINNLINNFYKLLLESKYVNFLREKLGNFYFFMIENSLRIYDEKIIDELVKENKLTSEYDKVMSSAQIEFRGEIYNLSQMGKFISDINRKTRKEASIAVDKWLGDNEKKIGDIYDELVHVRDNMAKKLGFKNFVELGYLRLYRSDYNSEMVSSYRKQISETVVNICQKLYKKQAKRLKLNFNKMAAYDFNIAFLDGNPKPAGDSQYLLECAKKMYENMSPETGEFFNFMLDNHLMDLIARQYKAPGGYMTFINKYKSPFIFANFNGTEADVNVLTHEVGHAFQGYLSRNISIPSYRMPTLEACEIHSMSMEFFAWPYMDLFFKDDAKKYCVSHLEDAIKFLPYGITIDEFQHWVYENPNVSHEERCKKFKEIESKYTPHKRYIDCPCYSHGGYWMRQTHVFSSPFYYIDYTLAQVIAMSFLVMMYKNKDKAFKKYIKLCKCGGKYPFLTLLEKNHLVNPFVDGNVKKIVLKAYKILKEKEL